MTIPFVLSQKQFADRFRRQLDKRSDVFIAELRALIAMPIGKGVDSGRIEVFMNDERLGNGHPEIVIYFDGPNRKVDHTDPTFFPGKSLPLADHFSQMEHFDPKYFSDERFGALNIQADVIKNWITECWWKAGGWNYPIRTELTIHDGYGDGNCPLLAPGRSAVEASDGNRQAAVTDDEGTRSAERKRKRLKTLEELSSQAQELGMGYES